MHTSGICKEYPAKYKGFSLKTLRGVRWIKCVPYL